MRGESHFFPPFRLDSKNEQLWRGSQEVRLRRKTFAVLRYLVERPGELVSKAVLLDSVWPDVSVSDSMPAISVRELRKALGDAVASPRFIETVQGRGYRFIATVTLQPGHSSAPNSAAQPSSQLNAAPDSFVAVVIGVAPPEVSLFTTEPATLPELAFRRLVAVAPVIVFEDTLDLVS